MDKFEFSKNRFFLLRKGLSRLKIGLVKNSGRNLKGRITVFSKGPGLNTYKYRIVNMAYKYLCSGIILDRALDRRRSAFIGCIFFFNGLMSYLLLPEHLECGDLFVGYRYDYLLSYVINPGVWSFINFFPIGSNIYNIELLPGFGGQLARAAGGFGQIISKHDRYVGSKVVVKLRSGLKVVVSNMVFCMYGNVSHIDWKYEKYKNAGDRRRLGFKPVVRGVAMNPCDHPHGGGEGKKSKKCAPRTPWGKLAIGTKTRNKLYILKRRNFMKKVEYYL